MEAFRLVFCCVLFTAVAAFSVHDIFPKYGKNDSLWQTAESAGCSCVNGRCVTDNRGNSKCVCKPGYALQDEFDCQPCDCGSLGKCIFLKHYISKEEVMYEKKCICDVGSAEKDGICIYCYCGENSACEFEGEEKKCYCIEGYSEREGACTKCDCGFYGECKFDGGKKVCRCDEGYLEVYGSCRECNCGDKGRCTFVNGIKFCSCEDGYSENNGICEECNCGRNSVDCNFFNGNKQCRCKNGYSERNGQCEECNCGRNSIACSFHEGNSYKMCHCHEGYVQKGGACEVGCSEYNQCQHGGYCNEGFCNCLPGTSGEFCEVIDACDHLCPKHQDINCVYDIFNKRPFCMCADHDLSFDSQSKMCRNSCNGTRRCLNGGICSPRGYASFCSCLEGTNGDFCEDIPECGNKRCGADANCMYDPAEKRAICVCRDAHLSFDPASISCKKTCRETSECKNGATCAQSGKEKFCKCAKGTEGDFCEKVPGCYYQDCGTDAECKYDVAGQRAVCTCKNGLLSFDSRDKRCKNSCNDQNRCLNGGICSSRGHASFCHCLEGTTRDFCELIPECAYKRCGSDAKCVYDPNEKKAICACIDAHLSFDPASVTCKKSCRETSECENGGTCAPSGKEKFCKCANGTEGDFCEKVPGCYSQDCGTDAECKYDVAGQRAVCMCKNGLLSFDSRDKRCKKSCNYDNQCHNGGKCSFEGHNKFCDCMTGTGGDLCETVEECVKNYTKCKDNSYCFFDVQKKKAVCECLGEGEKYDSLSEKCKLTCYEDATCKNGGLCMHRGEYLFCECKTGTSGMLCETVDDCVRGLCGYTDSVECLYDMTKETATCKCRNSDHLFDPESKTCRACDCGKNAVSCRYKDLKKVCSCRDGYDDINGNCQKVRCIENPCLNGKCEVIDGKEVCSCYEGYTLEGDYCKKLTCSKTPCVNGTCVVRHGNIEQCVCQVGYTLRNGVCVRGSCKPHTCFGGACKMIEGELTCVCPPRYHLEGVGCFESLCTIQRCFGGKCEVDEKKRETCTCLDGYVLVNDVCKLILCKKPCFGGQCKFIDGKEKCICPKGYSLVEDVCRANPMRP